MVEKEKLKAEEAASSEGLSSFQKNIFDLLYKIADIPFLDAYKLKILDVIEKAEKQPNTTIGALVSIVLVVLTVFFRILFGSKKAKVNVTEAQNKVAAETSDNQGSSEVREGENEKEDVAPAAAPRRRSTRRET